MGEATNPLALLSHNPYSLSSQMKMEIQIVSKKLITPSSSNHPPKMELSCLDQLAPPIYVHTIFYYPNDHHHNIENATHARIDLLEKSLSDTLSIFYPFAGRYVAETDGEHEFIDCNDRGAEFVRAQVIDAKLNDLLGRDRPDANTLSKFVRFDVGRHSRSSPLTLVQVNVFGCGGLAIGLSVSHVLADAHTTGLFCKTWGSRCRVMSERVVFNFGDGPRFDSASVFPPRDLSGVKLVDPPASVANVITRRFVFDSSAISMLRGRARSSSSRVQLVTALIWRTIIKMKRARHGGNFTTSLVTHALNIRGKTKTLPIDHNSCGNLWRLVLARYPPNRGDDDEEDDDDLLVGLVRESIREGAKELVEGEEIVEMAKKSWREMLGAVDEEVGVCNFTSWCRMGHYEVDFGWGRPNWASCANVPLDGYVVLVDGKDGVGIEAWVSLDQDKMVLFEQGLDIVELEPTSIGD